MSGGRYTFDSTRLDWTGVYYALFLLETLSNGILCDYSLSGTSVCRHEDALVALYGMDGHLLEGI